MRRLQAALEGSVRAAAAGCVAPHTEQVFLCLLVLFQLLFAASRRSQELGCEPRRSCTALSFSCVVFQDLTRFNLNLAFFFLFFFHQDVNQRLAQHRIAEIKGISCLDCVIFIMHLLILLRVAKPETSGGKRNVIVIFHKSTQFSVFQA